MVGKPGGRLRARSDTPFDGFWGRVCNLLKIDSVATCHAGGIHLSVRALLTKCDRRKFVHIHNPHTFTWVVSRLAR